MTPSIPPELPADNPQTRWYYSDENSQVVGPLSFVELEKFAAVGIVAPTTYVFEEGVTEWLPFSESRAARRLREPASLPAPPETSPHAISSKSQPRWLNKATEITTVIVTEIIREGYSLCRSFLGGASESEVAATPPAPHPIFEKLIKHWRTLALLYFLYPIGLFMLIRNKALSRRAKLGAGIGFGLIFLIAVGSLSSKPDVSSIHPENATFSTSSPATESRPKPTFSDPYSYQKTFEYKLALVNSGRGYLPADNITISRFRYLLRNAAEKTGDTPEAIADLACKGQGVVREDGKDVSVLEFMEQVNKLLSSPGLPQIKYQDAAILAIAHLQQ